MNNYHLIMDYILKVYSIDFIFRLTTNMLLWALVSVIICVVDCKVDNHQYNGCPVVKNGDVDALRRSLTITINTRHDCHSRKQKLNDIHISFKGLPLFTGTVGRQKLYDFGKFVARNCYTTFTNIMSTCKLC